MTLSRRNLSFGAATLLLAGAASVPAHATDLYFQMNPNLGNDGVRQAFVFGQAGATGTVSGNSFSQSFSLGSNGFATIDIPVAFQLSPGVVQNNGFRISSTSAISGYFLNRVPFTTDMTYLIDGSRLGTNYVVATYKGPNGPDQMSVQAIADNTSVTFQPKGAAPVTVTLNAGQTYLYNGGSDLTGSRITSTAPVSVFSGNQCSNIPNGAFACDHLVEQMPSVDQLSARYVLGKTPRTGTAGDVYRVVATEDGTVVRVNGDIVATLDQGDFYEGRLPGGAVVESSAKVLLAQYLVGSSVSDGANTDPAMTIVPGEDQWLNSYVFATPSGSADFPTDLVSIVTATSNIGSLRLNGAAVDGGLFSAIGSSGFSYGTLDVSGTSGPFTVTGDLAFQLLASGYDNFDSYFTYGGARFAPGASPAPDVPEPATWLAMVVGAAVIGGTLRRRRVTFGHAASA